MTLCHLSRAEFGRRKKKGKGATRIKVEQLERRAELEEPPHTCSSTRSFFGGAGSVTARWLRNLCISTRLGSWSSRTSVRNARSCGHAGGEKNKGREVRTREPELGYGAEE